MNNSLLENLNDIDRILNMEWQYVNYVINGKREDVSSELFECCVQCKKSLTRGSYDGKKLIGKYGIYIFVLTEDVMISSEEFARYQSISGARIKERIEGETVFFEEQCLYTGSSIRNSLYVRINQHFNNKIKPAALHIGHRNRNVFMGKTVVYAFPIKKEFYEYLKIIVPQLETYMHEQFCPIAGSSRT